jgi:Type ISP C-terminal specificity domain/N-6 DNA Methylase
MSLLASYCANLQAANQTSKQVKETACYSALQQLCNAVGRKLKPQVHCRIGRQAQRAEFAGEFFVQLPRLLSRVTAGRNSLSARGCLIIKSQESDLQQVAHSEQVLRALARYQQVLATNYWEFLLITRKVTGVPQISESYRLATSAEEFWTRLPQAQPMVLAHEERFFDYLSRVMYHFAPLVEPPAVARFLASYAREAKARLDLAPLSLLAPLQQLLAAMLGLPFEGELGRKLFVSNLIQTLFYGIFSAWVLWHERAGQYQPQMQFDWRKAAAELHVPAISTIFKEITKPSELDKLNLVEILDWTSQVLERVDRQEFFSRFAVDHVVQYFYEPFLEAFDPQLRRQLGVWYTPPEIVRYMVTRVDQVLRSELGVNGLAAENVYFLDPCCGTGTYLIEVLQQTYHNLQVQQGEAFAKSQLPQLLARVVGWELLPAPFIIAHLQIGRWLQKLGTATEPITSERAQIFLTDALTNWEQNDPTTPSLPKLQKEGNCTGKVKLNAPILVVIGNPPYNAFTNTNATNATNATNEVVAAYKVGLSKDWNIKKFNLDDLYVQFFRLAERQIVEKTGRGIICYLANYSWTTEASYVVMRQRFLANFDKIWIDNLNGDSRRTGKLTPDGQPDPSVFSTKLNPKGIRIGTAISLMLRTGQSTSLPSKLRKITEQLEAKQSVSAEKPAITLAPATLATKSPTVYFREFWGTKKRQQLLASLTAIATNGVAKNCDSNDLTWAPPDTVHCHQYQLATPERRNCYSFYPVAPTEYLRWPKLTELAARAPITGYQENRGFGLIDPQKDWLRTRMQQYFDPQVDWQDLLPICKGLTKDTARFNAQQTRKKALTEGYQEQSLHRYLLRPLEVQWCYYSRLRPLWNEHRPALTHHHFPSNKFLITRPVGVAEPEGVPFYFTSYLADYDMIRGHSYHFPVMLNSADNLTVTCKNLTCKNLIGVSADLDLNPVPKANLSVTARQYLADLGLDNPDEQVPTASLIWLHALAIGYTPDYLTENAAQLRQGWPRLPLPTTATGLKNSAHLGTQIATLLDALTALPGITETPLLPIFRAIGVLVKARASASSLVVNVGWGRRGNQKIVMPGKGKLHLRDYSVSEQAALQAAADHYQLSYAQVVALLGHQTYDVYLNATTYWQNIPQQVWKYTIGGYPVIKKWLSYRETTILARPLELAEVHQLRQIAQRLTALILLSPILNRQYHYLKSNSYDFDTS